MSVFVFIFLKRGNSVYVINKMVHDGFVAKHCFPNKAGALYDGSVVRAYFICVLRMYIIYYALGGTYIIYIYIFSYSAVATASVLQTIRPSRMPTHRQPPIPFHRPKHKPSLTTHASPVTRQSSPTHLQPPPPASLSLYIITYTTPGTPPSVPGRARRVIYVPPSSPPPSPPRHRVDYRCTPADATKTLYIMVYTRTRPQPFSPYVLYEFRSTLCRVDGPMTCTIT